MLTCVSTTMDEGFEGTYNIIVLHVEYEITTTIIVDVFIARSPFRLGAVSVECGTEHHSETQPGPAPAWHVGSRGEG